jgi:ComF family protein
MPIEIDGAWRGFRRRLLDFLFPPLCISCREQVLTPSSFCPACWQKVAFLDGPCCLVCGLPFERDPGFETLCGACHVRRPAYDAARAILRYDDASKPPILAFKHADRLDLAPGFAQWLARAGREWIAQADVVVPVPLHPRRLWTRRYNQASEIARHLARRHGKIFEPFALRRARRTPSQGDMPSAKARRRNVHGAFVVTRAARGAFRGKTVLLIDDVLTTGATVEACALALKRAGAAKVVVLALARVVRPLSANI